MGPCVMGKCWCCDSEATGQHLPPGSQYYQDEYTYSDGILMRNTQKMKKMEIKNRALDWNKLYDIMKSATWRMENLLLAALWVFEPLLCYPDFQVISGDYLNWHRCPESTNYSWREDSLLKWYLIFINLLLGYFFLIYFKHLDCVTLFDSRMTPRRILTITFHHTD